MSDTTAHAEEVTVGDRIVLAATVTGSTIFAIAVGDPETNDQFWISRDFPGLTTEPPAAEGVWFAYYCDWTGAAPFADEASARRYAAEHDVDVKFVEYGEPLR